MHMKHMGISQTGAARFYPQVESNPLKQPRPKGHPLLSEAPKITSRRLQTAKVRTGGAAASPRIEGVLKSPRLGL